MSSPATSTTSTLVGAPSSSSQRPARNKSSTTLSSMGMSAGGSGSGFRAKRNKSSSSLHAGHHNVHFVSHSKKSGAAAGSGKRSGSHGASSARRPTVDFGFTSMVPQQQPLERRSSNDRGHVGSDDEDEDEREEFTHEQIEQERAERRRPSLNKRRESSASSVATLRDGEQPAGRSMSRDHPSPVVESPHRSSVDPSREEEERSRSRSRSRGPPGERAGPRPPKIKPPAPPPPIVQQPPLTPLNVASSLVSTTSNASDWESATDSPLVIGGKRLPPVAAPSGEGTVSGLGQAMHASGEESLAAPAKEDQQVTPSKVKGKGKPLFEIDNTENEEETPPSPPPPQHQPQSETARLPSNAKIHPASNGGSTTPSQQVVVDVHPSTPSPPTTSPASSKATPPPSQLPKPTASTSNTVPFPSTQSPRSPDRPQPRPGPSKRKSSNASIMSISSSRSFAGSTLGNLMGHGTSGGGPGGLRRSASGAIPTVGIDRAAVGVGELEAGPTSAVGERFHHHGRTESMGSMRSLRSVAEGGAGSGGQRRAATMGLDVSPRQGGGGLQPPQRSSTLAPSQSSGALASLASWGIPAAKRSSTLAPGESATAPSSPASKRGSSYFATLRGFATQTFTPPAQVSPNASRTNLPINALHHPPSALTTRTAAAAAAQKQRTRSSPTAVQPFIISKFVEPAPPSESMTPNNLLSSSPGTGTGGMPGRTLSSASLASGGASMSRTQQKALLARDAPYWANGSRPSDIGTVGGGVGSSGIVVGGVGMGRQGSMSGLSTISGSTSAGGREQGGMRNLALGLVKEVERIERQYRAVQKWRDPLGESLERILSPSSAGGTSSQTSTALSSSAAVQQASKARGTKV